jgi:hypothetical protein
MAKVAIDRAKKHTVGKDNLTWGTFISSSILGKDRSTLAMDK